MNTELVILALLVGAANWVFRVGPMKVGLPGAGGGGAVARFLNATGPAAIATLFAASVLPEVQSGHAGLPLVAGTAATAACFGLSRSVGLSTVLGAVAYGLATLV